MLWSVFQETSDRERLVNVSRRLSGLSFAGGLGGEIQKTRPAVIVSNDAAN
jgi:hypothetical protein